MTSPQSDSEPQANAAARQLETAAAGWTARLTLSVVAGLAVEAITGIWILAAPFSVVAQLQVLLHTAAGILLVAPYATYQWRHYRDWASQSLSVVKLIGFASMAFAASCIVSGIAVTWNSLAGPKLSYAWDEIHLVTGAATAVLVVLHLAFALARRSTALRQIGGYPARFRRRWLGAAGGIVVACLALAAASRLVPRIHVNLPMPAGYTLPKYAQKFAEYRGNPFAPTYARTSTGRLVNPEVLAHSETCGTSGCHEQILAEWEPNAHRFSAMNPPFLSVQKKFAHDRSPAETRYCAGCHDPISLFAGAKDVTNPKLAATGMQEGTSCVVCHSISKVDQRGNADYVVTPPTRYIGELGGGIAKRISDFLIRAYPRQHLADYNRSVLRTPELCGACHKQFVPEALNRFGASMLQDQYDEWRKSHWNVPGHPYKTLSCRDCHMRLVRDSRDPAAGQSGDVRRTPDDDTHRHHGFIATNLFMPAVLKLPHYKEHDRLTEEWIQGKTVLPEIANIWPKGPVASIELTVPNAVQPGGQLRVRVVVRNRKAGHNFITGPLDFIRAWVHLRVFDSTGALLAEWGGIDPATRDILDRTGVLHTSGKRIPNGTLVLESVPLDAAGNPLVRHDLWKKSGATGLRVLFAGYADMQAYDCAVPASARSPLTVRAELDYRRYRQEFLNLMAPTMERDTGVYQPTVAMDAATAEVALKQRGPTAQSISAQ